MIEVYLFDNGNAIEARNAETDETLYIFTYKDNGTLIWNYKDAWRIMRANHLPHDYYKEVFKCRCGNIIKLPNKISAKISEYNRVNFDLKCECGNTITVECDTLKINGN